MILRRLAPHLHHPTRLELDGQSWLFVGGAISVNRFDRIPNETWWIEEEMNLDELVTHTGPTWTLPPRSDLKSGRARPPGGPTCPPEAGGKGIADWKRFPGRADVLVGMRVERMESPKKTP